MGEVARYFVACDGKQFGETVWCDPDGVFQTGEVSEQGNFFFHRTFASSDGKFLYVRCKERYRSRCGETRSCKVTAKIEIPEGRAIYVEGEHSHRPEYAGHGFAVYKARAGWITQLREDPSKNTMEALYQERRGLDMDIASEIIPSQHDRTARRQAEFGRPPKVGNLQDLHDAINSSELPGFTLTRDNEKLISLRCPIHDSIVVTTRRQLNLLRSATMVHCDATYKTVPLGLCEQLFTIHCNWEGRHVGMVAMAFMKKKSSEAYREIYRAIKREVPGLVIARYMGDYDAAMRDAMRAEFIGVRIYGCLFHFAQCIVRYAKRPEVGLATALRRSKSLNSMLLSFCSLPLLPMEYIQETFESCAMQAVEMDSRFAPVVEYIRSQWLGSCSLEELSLFGAPCRTNNAVESNNALLAAWLKCHGPTWDLIGAICRLAQDVATNKTSHDKGHNNIRKVPGLQTRLNDALIRTNSDRLRVGYISPEMFIRRVKFRVGGSALKGEKKKAKHHRKLRTAAAKITQEDVDVAVHEAESNEQLFDWVIHTPEENLPTPIDHDYSRAPLNLPCPRDHEYLGGPFQTNDELPDAPPVVASPLVIEVQKMAAEYGPEHQRMSKEMLAVINDALSAPLDQVVTKVANHHITRRDLGTLLGLAWLNDKIINAYMILIMNRSHENSKLPRVYVFDTFFLELLKKGERVANWTTNIDIFDFDLLMLPVHANQHWSLVIMDLRRKEMKYLDSLGTRNSQLLRTLLAYLKDEYRRKKQRILNVDEWFFPPTDGLPRQGNGSDCGMFTLKYAEYEARDASISFTQSDIPYFRWRIMYELLQSTLH